VPGPNQSNGAKATKDPKTGEKRSASQAEVTVDDLEDMEMDETCD
jgi:hypothetical protein